MKLSRQLFVIHSLIITLLVAGYAWLSLLNVRQLTVQELVNQSNTAAQYLSDPLHLALMSANQELYQAKIDSFYDAGIIHVLVCLQRMPLNPFYINVLISALPRGAALVPNDIATRSYNGKPRTVSRY
ncbi:hypothetical protein [Psychrosphaera algicola]|uniref:Uncharacterized protein n=1 Tax=Psychrosphaera algicola TaxID=3023714 RepID=A0ABT5FEX1_9GAMM|nr:hypothetical protein [Psychrosphaera sp. G1-22]MDC2890084.1 hypothetical protein [Psychrosphaera sp. G1-22]